MTKQLTVGDIERGLFAAFPREDAESWDNPGLAVGDRAQPAAQVAVALDMSACNVIAAAEAGCNVLVTHHPPFIKEGPDEFGPQTQALTGGPGRAVYEAARLGVSCIAMHTNADRAIATRERFADLLGCECIGNFESLLDPSVNPQGNGLGAMLIPDWDAASTLGRLAGLCARSFDSQPRVWGDPDRLIERFAFLNGSWGDPGLYDCCIEAGVDCIVVGETRYHMCVDAQPYLSIIDLGHDRSELPIVDVLIDALVGGGVAHGDIVDLRDAHLGWWTVG